MVQLAMDKTEAIKLLGGSTRAAADAIGVTYQAVDKWPDQLPQRIVDRVQAALWRMSQQGEAPPMATPAEAKAA